MEERFSPYNVLKSQRDKDIKETCDCMRNNLEDDYNDCHDTYIEDSLEEHISEYKLEMGYEEV